MSRARGFYLVADVDGAVVGQCMVTYEWSDWRNGEFWWIQSVYVRPDCRRQGIFARLYRTVEAMAEARPDVTGLRLYVETANETAQAAYARLGMRRAPYVLLERDYAKERTGRDGPDDYAGNDRKTGAAADGSGGSAPPATDARGPGADGEGDARHRVQPGSSIKYRQSGLLNHEVQ